MSADPDPTAMHPAGNGRQPEEPTPSDPAAPDDAAIAPVPVAPDAIDQLSSNGASSDGAEPAVHANGDAVSAAASAAFPSFPAPGTEASAAPAPPRAAPSPPAAAAAGGDPPPPPKSDALAAADEHAMTLWEHLEELRSRMIRMILAFIGGGIFAWIYREELLGWLTAPFVRAWPKAVGEGARAAALYFPSPASLFLAYVRLAAIGGLVFALPFILYQIWAFVAPGLYSREKRFAAPFVVSSCTLFAIGGWFGWRFAFPVAFQYLLGFSDFKGANGIKIEPNVMISEYIEFVTHMLLAFGFMSQLPVLVFFLSIAGIVNHRHLIKFFRYFIVVAFVVAAVITPPDPMSQLMLAVPLVFLYGVSILVAYVFGRKNLKPAP